MLAFSPSEIDKKQTHMKIYPGGQIKQLFHGNFTINIYILREVITLQNNTNNQTTFITQKDLQPFFLLIDTMQYLLTYLSTEQQDLLNNKHQSMVNYCKINTAISTVGFEMDNILNKY